LILRQKNMARIRGRKKLKKYRFAGGRQNGRRQDILWL